MKHKRKLVSILLILLSLFQILSPCAFAITKHNFAGSSIETQQETMNPQDKESKLLSETEKEKITQFNSNALKNRSKTVSPILKEVTELRTQYEKHFQHADGSFSLAAYSDPVHYQDTTGVWQEIDNTLVATRSDKGKVFKNRAGEVEFKMPETFSNNNGIIIKRDGAEINWKLSSIVSTDKEGLLENQLLNSKVKAKINNPENHSNYTVNTILTEKDPEIITKFNQNIVKANNTTSSVSYKDLLPNIDFEYILSSGSLKENIIVKKPTDQYLFVFDLSFDGLQEERQKDGSYAFYKKNDHNSPVFIISAPCMYDAKDNLSTDIKLNLENDKLYLEADADWINCEERHFPVVIDPLITINNSGCQNTYVSNFSKNTNYESGKYTYVGTDIFSTRRAYYKFPLDSVQRGINITNASFIVKQKRADTASGRKIYCYDLTNKPSWNPQTITWNNQPVSTALNGPQNSGDLTKIDYVTYTNTSEYLYCFNVTNTIRYWFESGAASNNGLLLTIDNENTDCQSQLYSTNIHMAGENWPYLLMEYIRPVGLEDYWSYETVDLGRSGVVYVNDYNGNLTYTHSDLSMTGNRLPIQISHVYNSSDNKYSSSMPIGKNFFLNYQEQLYVRADQLDLSISYYEYHDSDRTVHEFRKNSSDVFVEVNNTTTYIRFDGNDKTIVDAQGNEKTFDDQGRLKKIKDANGNEQIITYSDGRITQITDVVGRSVTFSYNENKQLIGITDPGNRTISYQYSDTSATANLIRITYPDGKYTAFSYNGDLLTNITTFDQQSITVEYTNTGYYGAKVKKLHQFDKSDYEFDNFTITYLISNSSGRSAGNNYVTKKDGSTVRFLFDDLGRVTEKINDFDQTQYTVYDSNANSNSFNKLLQKSDLQTISSNLLLNHGFENWSYWSTIQVSNNGSYGINTEEARRGFKSMKLQLDGEENETVAVGQYVSVLPDTSYTLSADVFIPEELELNGNNGASFGVSYSANGISHTESYEFIGKTSGWERFSKTITFPNETISSCQVFLRLDGTEGVVYFDDIQMEKSAGARYYNLVENSDFSFYGNSMYPNLWNSYLIQSSDLVYLNNDGIPEFRAVGHPDFEKELLQNIPVNAQPGETLIIGGKASAFASKGSNDGRDFCVLATIYSSDTEVADTVQVNFDRGIFMEKQTKAASYTLTTPCHHIALSLLYHRQIGTVTFNNAFVYVDGFGEQYSYTSSGLVASVQNDEGKCIDYTYSSQNDLTSVTQTLNGETQTIAEMTYDANHNITCIENNIGTSVEFQYNNGQIVSQIITEQLEGSQPHTETESMTYLQGGNYLKTYTNANGGVTTYTYDNEPNPIRGVVLQVEDPNGSITSYTYDNYTDAVLSVQGNADSNTSSTVAITRQDDVISSLQRENTTYTFSLDDQGRVDGNWIGTKLHDSRCFDLKGRPHLFVYSNGNYQRVTYDDRDRIISKTWYEDPIVTYDYSENDRLSHLVDLTTNTTYQYDYAFYNLLHRVIGSDGTRILYDYDRYGNLSHLTFSKDNDTIYQARYTTNQKGNPDDIVLVSMGNTLLHYNYDGFSRLTGFSNGPVITSLSYSSGTSAQVQCYVTEDRSGSQLHEYSYSYDDNGNIISISDTANLSTLTYSYDGLNRLTSVSDGTNVTNYVYDVDGNLTSVLQNNVAIHTYSYNNSDWGDQLTTFDNKTITYDQVGNPLSYNGKSFTWQRGTQLAGITGGSDSISYTYDAQDRRVQKTVNGVTTTYLYAEGMLMRQTTGNNTLDFAYDTDSLIGFKYNDTPYFYEKNLFGDVVAVLDEEGTVVASYSYDAYGNVISATGTMAAVNPIRYRGYYQDAETGWYYLKTRYYNPEWGRFINADSQFMAGEDAINGANMYAYCFNNPIMYTDKNGDAPNDFSQFAVSVVKRLQTIVPSVADVMNSQQQSATIGKIITPFAVFFMTSIFPGMNNMMNTLFSGTEWEERNYGFFSLKIGGVDVTRLRSFAFSDMSIFARIGAAVLDFHKDPTTGNYTTLEGSTQWQKTVDYVWWYDYFFSVGGPNMKTTFPFNCTINNSMKHFVVWCWKGDYWNLGAGAEIGIYYSDNESQANNGYYRVDPDNLKLSVRMTVEYNNTTITDGFTQTNWWVTSFTPSCQSPKMNLLKAKFDFSFAANLGNNCNALLTNRFTAKANSENWVSNKGLSFLQNSMYDFRIKL